MKFAALHLLLMLKISSNLSIAQEPIPFQIQAMIASIGGDKSAAAPKMELGKPKYFSPDEFKTLHKKWFLQSGIDFLTINPLPIAAGGKLCVDLSGSAGVQTNCVGTPIPTNATGIFLRYEAGASSNPFELDCLFVYNSKEPDKGVVRKSRFIGRVSYSSNEVAVIRLPQITEISEAPRRILGIRMGKTTTYDNRQVYLSLQLIPPSSK
jgi:hypothetical protein